ncbi:hypothetical protein A2W54_03490 [Candidatus Giovannonibacteria bacterium RIFCSPHIGHO2_02_43_13]|uniref:Transketolase-like pyrimidine-binding domain-containing protein n=1 Tax=Candidatus Giovannonibacteria bacterium RIFCSPHIGHO2_02_43_13 TaxID=1798330 RepID=A0A1F5WQA9_9BACT|nr:MAG: 2-oxoisovalerate dehydrogenase beta (E1) subunit [Parcubacteria group bacterium GW2011_GWA2_44_13]OGF73949.1 MAG: hypothetical protein A3E06_00700 [Candidatus Giovannonibacteria bacterium RIFCSPHIGHO2_12_FULL_44_42]OGF77839.1 MAG: hypothetical protein A2W54_03490 [Candidatus Giovannonibacteria bacterium RIFCSPHIGHO2_02_43_13]OGF88825.1 MAG: hypothetical protein A3I94_02365 [Candidatus Giovannonibacteria bacterium RIFCSPLOWO2_02_FULL_43_54]OGF96789.1 MAG: hypothetical protein A3H08_01255
MPHSRDFTPRRKIFIPTPEEYLLMYRRLAEMTYFGKMLDERKEEFKPLKVFTGLGQEAIYVGAMLAAESSYDLLAPDHRSTCALPIWGITEEEIIAQYGAYAESLYGGYDFGIHIGDIKRRTIRFISDMGANTTIGAGVIDGIYYLRDYIDKNGADENPILLAFFGDGAMSHGNIHSAFELASTRHLPVIFILNNNCLAIRTPNEYQNPEPEFAKRAAGYGMHTRTIFGNDTVLVWRTVKEAAHRIRSAKDPHPPHFIECQTVRVSGHNAHETGEMWKYFPRELKREWEGRNPLELFSLLLLSQKEDVFNEKKKQELLSAAKEKIEKAFEIKKKFTAPSKLRPTFKPSIQVPATPASVERELRYGDAITEALCQAMDINPKIRIFGEDVELGGVHGITKKIFEKFGSERIFNMPLDENCIVAFMIGQALSGVVPCGEIQFFPFTEYGLAFLTRFAGTHFAVTGENLRMVLRAPCGGGFVSNEEHQKMIESSLAHAGGLKIVFPSTAFDAKGLLLSSLSDGNPVIFCEQIEHYTKKGLVPIEPYYVPIGKAALRKNGEDISLITYGALMVERTLKAAEILKTSHNINAEILDLRTIVPMDKEAVLESVDKTSRALIIHEAKKDFGVGAEISDLINRELFDKLWAPVERLGAKEGPATARQELEILRLPQVEDIVKAAKGVVLWERKLR